MPMPIVHLYAQPYAYQCTISTGNNPKVMWCPITGYQSWTTIHICLTCSAHAHAHFTYLCPALCLPTLRTANEKKPYGNEVPYYRLQVLYNRYYIFNLQCPCPCPVCIYMRRTMLTNMYSQDSELKKSPYGYVVSYYRLLVLYNITYICLTCNVHAHCKCQHNHCTNT